VLDRRQHVQTFFFIPLVIYFALGITAFTIGLNSIRSFAGGSSLRARMVFRMFFYTFAFIVCWTGPLAHRSAQFWDVDSTFLLYCDAVGQSVQGFVNALVWLTNPTFFKSFKQVVLLKVPLLRTYFNIKLDESMLPLLGDLGVHEYLHDTRQDMQKMDVIIRKNIITFLLFGMKQACEDVQSSLYDPVMESHFKQIRHIKTLEDERASSLTKEYRFVDYSPIVFQKLREHAGITPEAYLESIRPEKFIQSLSSQKFSEGRSGSFFCFSPDKCLIIKTIPESEAQLLSKILPAYYQYITSNPESRIMRIYGLHAIQMHYGDQVFVIVMNNAFRTHRRIHERYDLKGSWVRREVGKPFLDNPLKVLGMDMDLKRMGRKMRLTNEQRPAFLQQIERDATFLCSLDIMDYSILIGFHFVDREADNAEASGPKEPKESPVGVGGGTKEQEEEMCLSAEKENCFPLHRRSSESLHHDPDTHEEDRKGKRKAERHHQREQEEQEDVELGSKLRDEGITSVDGKEIYYLCIIDILQLYDLNKKAERFWKVYVMRKDFHGVSVQPPPWYRDRFMANASSLITSPENELSSSEAIPLPKSTS